MEFIKTQKWIGAAALLGMVFFLAVLLVKPIGVSTQFSVLSGIVHSAIAPDLIAEDAERESGYVSTNAYYDKGGGKLAADIKNPLKYDFIFVLSIVLGAYMAHLLGKKRNGSLPEAGLGKETCPIAEKGPWLRYLPSFIGGFILLYGARMADGCTSGHMMSGMMQGSVSGYLFAAAVFAAAIPTAVMVHRKTSRRTGR